MSPGIYSRTLWAAAAFLSLVFVAAECALAGGQYVIVAAEPPTDEYAPGRILDVNDRIEIPQGTVVTLLGEDGSVNAIPGPASIVVTEEAVASVGQENRRSTISKLADLLSGDLKNADSLGVARSFSSRPRPRGLDDPWAISVHEDGAACIRDQQITLGRKSDAETISVAVAGDDPGHETVLTWREGEADLQLPQIAVDEGRLMIRAGSDRAHVELRRLPSDINLSNPVDVLDWMISQGCDSQALAFTRRLVLEAR